jgi:uncharacterized membrane protein
MILFPLAIRFANLLLAAMVTGAMFGLWLAFNSKTLDGPGYIVIHQQSVRGMNSVMPVLGLVTILTTIAVAYLTRGDKARLVLLIVAILAFIATGLITRFVNQPINAVIMGWSPSSPPAEWTALRDTWWHWHVIRIVCGVTGLSLLILVELLRDRSV